MTTQKQKKAAGDIFAGDQLDGMLFVRREAFVAGAEWAEAQALTGNQIALQAKETASSGIPDDGVKAAANEIYREVMQCPPNCNSGSFNSIYAAIISKHCVSRDKARSHAADSEHYETLYRNMKARADNLQAELESAQERIDNMGVERSGLQEELAAAKDKIAVARNAFAALVNLQ